MQRGLARVIAAVLSASAIGLLIAAEPAAATTQPDQWVSEYAGVGSAGNNPGEHVITASSASKLSEAWQKNTPVGVAAPAIVGGVVYNAADPGNADDGGVLYARSARTGALLWSTHLAHDADYLRGQTVVGNLILLSFEGVHQLGGVTAVNLTTRKVVWSRSRPPSSDPADDDGTGSAIEVDSGRFYLYGGDNALSAYRVSDGKLLWQINTGRYEAGIAAYGGSVYASGPGGLQVFSGTTGATRWTSANFYGAPIVAGGRVFAASYQGVSAVSAAGCGATTCRSAWSRAIPNSEPGQIQVSGGDASIVFVTATIFHPTGPDTAIIERLSAASGAVQWSSRLPVGSWRVARAGTTVWIVSGGTTLVGWSTTATTSTPLRSTPIPMAFGSALQNIAIANGTLVIQTWVGYLTGYRIPGT